jgi:hypothetical protein
MPELSSRTRQWVADAVRPLTRYAVIGQIAVNWRVAFVKQVDGA